MENIKELKDMTEGEILRQQMELLAEISKNTSNINELAILTAAMVQIYKAFYLP